MLLSEVVGYTAAIVGTGLMLPQVLRTVKTKKVADLSWGMLWLYFFNCLLWFTYGMMIAAMPVVVCNFIAMGISILQLFLKHQYS